MSRGKEIGSLTTTREGSGPASWSENAWHEQGVNLFPKSNLEFESLERCVEEFILTGHIPNAPLLTNGSKVTTIGSCFAAELRHFLSTANLGADSFWVPSGLNNTFALRDFISWCVTGEETSEGFRYERDDNGKIKDWLPEESRNEYLGYLKATDAFVFTLGLSEIWRDKETGKVFWRGIPERIFDEKRHEFRQSRVSENVENLRAIVQCIRLINPTAQIIFTLSPVPLKATYKNQSCITADCVSKSTLRVAIDEVMSEKLESVWYWPSFEVVKWVGCHLPYPVYGTDDNVVRHVSRYEVMTIIRSFVKAYYGEGLAREAAECALQGLSVEEGIKGEPPLMYKGTIVRG